MRLTFLVTTATPQQTYFRGKEYEISDYEEGFGFIKAGQAEEVEMKPKATAKKVAPAVAVASETKGE